METDNDEQVNITTVLYWQVNVKVVYYILTTSIGARADPTLYAVYKHLANRWC